MSQIDRISEGNDTIIERVSRINGATPEKSLKIDGTTGVADFAQMPTVNGVAAAPLTATVTLTAAQVKTLNATAVEVIPAPPAGKYIEVISCHARLVYNSAAYDGVGVGDDLVLKYTDKNGGVLTEIVPGSGFGDAVATTSYVVPGVKAGFTPVAAAKVVAHILVGEWYAAAGDSPVKLEVLYRIRTLAI